MKEKIIAKATEMFLKLGFKSITMDDIACEMCISKKTIYKYFINKEVLIAESTETMHNTLHHIIETIIAQNHNPIKENFEIRKLIKETFQSSEKSPLYQLKKHYPEIHRDLLVKEMAECTRFLRQNILRGIAMGLYRPNIQIEDFIKFYYILIFHINENTVLEHEAQKQELSVLEYHTRAIASEAGIAELEKQLANPYI
jgi:AcrR family transcriptional regulator